MPVSDGRGRCLSEIGSLFRAFYRAFPFLEIDPLIEYFAVFGGMGDQVVLDPFSGLEANIETQILSHFDETLMWITPSYLMDDPYRKLLIAVARGDGKLLNIFRRAGLSETVGGSLLHELESLGILRIEASREPPVRRGRKNQPVPKELRGYRIQAKARFVRPFHRFWFGFVAPYARELEQGEFSRFWDNYRRHRDRALSLIFEHLSEALLVHTLADNDPVLSSGSWWDRRSEYDLLLVTRSGRLILGECKYTGRAVTKRELTKLQDKAAQTGLRVDTYALFSRNGFSKELSGMAGEGLMLFGIEEFGKLVDG